MAVAKVSKAYPKTTNWHIAAHAFDTITTCKTDVREHTQYIWFPLCIPHFSLSSPDFLLPLHSFFLFSGSPLSLFLLFFFLRFFFFWFPLSLFLPLFFFFLVLPSLFFFLFLFFSCWILLLSSLRFLFFFFLPFFPPFFFLSFVPPFSSPYPNSLYLRSCSTFSPFSLSFLFFFSPSLPTLHFFLLHVLSFAPPSYSPSFLIHVLSFAPPSYSPSFLICSPPLSLSFFLSFFFFSFLSPLHSFLCSSSLFLSSCLLALCTVNSWN